MNNCNYCKKEYDRKMIMRMHGNLSSVHNGGYCSAQCYTAAVLEPAPINTTQEKYKAIKKKLGLTDTQLAEMFGYTSLQSYASSSGKIKVVRGIVALYERIGERFSDTFDID